MARKATVDVEEVLQLLRDGQSTQSVAERFGVTRQAIDLHRRKFIQNGELIARRAPRSLTASQNSDEMAKISVSLVSLDQLIELVIEAFESLKKVPKLEAELEKYKQDYEKAAGQIEFLQKEVRMRETQQSRWQQVIRSDEIQPPDSK